MNLLALVNRLLKPLDNKVLGTTVRVALILYASLIAPELPDVVARQLDNLAVRSVLIFLIAYLAVKDPVTAALATLALMVTVMSLHRRDVQGVLGKAASLASKPTNLAGQALGMGYDLGSQAVGTGAGLVGKAVDIAEDVVGSAIGNVGSILGYNGAQEAKSAPQQAVPLGVEDGMDNTGSL